MAVPDLTITYPADGAGIPTADKTYTLQANGKDAPGYQLKLESCTISQDGKQLNVKTKLIFPFSPWLLEFDDIPVDPTYKAKYTVHVEDDHGRKTDSTFQFTEPQKRRPTHPRVLLQSPGNPASGGTVSGSGFYVQGSSDPHVPLYAVMFEPGGPTYIGIMVLPPPGYAFLFQNVPPGSNYIIYITEWTSPPQTTAITNVTVT